MGAGSWTTATGSVAQRGLTLPSAEMIKKNPAFPVGDLVDDPQSLDTIVAVLDMAAASGPY